MNAVAGTKTAKILVYMLQNVSSAANYIVIGRDAVRRENLCLYCGKDVSDLGRQVCPACEKDLTKTEKNSVHKFLKKRGKKK